MLSSRFFWFLCIGIFLRNAESRLDGEEIVGGSLAEEGQFPYQVYLHVPNMPDYICGGAIIDEYHVVTAAHCVINWEGFFETTIKVKVGVIDGNECTNDYLVEKIFIPWQFVPTETKKKSNVIHDIAVLKLSRSLDLSPESELRPVKLPEKQEVLNPITNKFELRYSTYANEKAMISGYGWTSVTVGKNINDKENGTTDRQLRFADSTVLPPFDCQKFTNKDPALVLCAKMTQREESPGRGACAADSGSPLVFNNTLIGVLSTSPRGCTEEKRPAGYTRVSKFIGFIKNATEGSDESMMRVAELSVEYRVTDLSASSELAKDAWKPREF